MFQPQRFYEEMIKFCSPFLGSTSF